MTVHIRQLRWSDYDAVVAVGTAARLVLPDNGVGLRFWQARGYLPLPGVLCSKPMLAGSRI